MRPLEPLKPLARRLLPRRVRRWLRDWLHEFPQRWRDLPADLRDLRDRLARRRSAAALPPPALRRAVGRTHSREEFLRVGRQVADDLWRAFEETRAPVEEYPLWLDFGCGAGRVARCLATRPGIEIFGADVDARAIRWLRRRTGGDRFRRSSPRPPLPFPAASFDVVYAVSVFTHLDEGSQLEWLEEIVRVLRPGGLLLASTHAEDLAWSRPDLRPEQHIQLRETGFLFAEGFGAFNDHSTFHARGYLERVWGAHFRLLAHRPHGVAAFQDLSVWRRPEGEPVRRDRDLPKHGSSGVPAPERCVRRNLRVDRMKCSGVFYHLSA